MCAVTIRSVSLFFFSHILSHLPFPKWGKTALMYAAAKGDAPAMKILIDAGADIDTLDNVFFPHAPLLTDYLCRLKRQ